MNVKAGDYVRCARLNEASSIERSVEGYVTCVAQDEYSLLMMVNDADTGLPELMYGAFFHSPGRLMIEILDNGHSVESDYSEEDLKGMIPPETYWRNCIPGRKCRKPKECPHLPRYGDIK